VRVTYDASVDMAYIYLGERNPGSVHRSEEFEPEDKGGTLVLDFDNDGHLLGIEVFRARERLPAALLERAQQL
jgi:uncharacterized protein YuzE